MRTTDTIAAIATALTPSGIGIVRISGENAIEIADKIYKGKKSLSEVDSHTINYGFIVDPATGEKVDQVLVMVMKAPRTYTGEETVEIDCHGGVLVLNKILKMVIDAGANLAEPGEFTKRAFLNGKIDLTQAEAVADIIDAENNNALRCSVKQLRGSVRNEIKDIRAKLLLEIAFIEAALDDPEHYSLDEHTPELMSVLSDAMARVKKLLDTADSGIVLKQGINTVIIGKPNAGKSSIYNLLSKSDKAIVTDIAGTTRDTLTEHINLDGVKLNITDTAGLRDTGDVVEKIGVERAKAAALDADLILCVLDSSSKLTDEDIGAFETTIGRNAIILLNKTDIDSDEKISVEDIAHLSDKKVIEFSAVSGSGLEELEKEIKKMFFKGEININDEIYITSMRQKAALAAAFSSLELAKESAGAGMPEDIISVDLTNAFEELGRITGDTVSEEIINEIFAKFCMGK